MQAARDAYTALSVAQKALVTNLADLVAAEAQITALTAATDAVVAAEAGDNDLSTQVLITAAQDLYDTANLLMEDVVAG